MYILYCTVLCGIICISTGQTLTQADITALSERLSTEILTELATEGLSASPNKTGQAPIDNKTTGNARMENPKQASITDGAMSSLKNQLLRRLMMDSHSKPQDIQQQLNFQRMQQEIKIQKLQQELQERKLQQARLQQMLALQNQAASLNLPSEPAVSSFGSFGLTPEPAQNAGFTFQSDHGQVALKALPKNAMMQALRQRLDGTQGQSAGSLLSNSKLDPMSIGFQKPDQSLSKPFDITSMMNQQKPEVKKPATNKHTINITVKRKTKIDVPGLPVRMPVHRPPPKKFNPPALKQVSLPALNQFSLPVAQAKAQAPTNVAGISPDLLQMLDALRAGNNVVPAQAPVGHNQKAKPVQAAPQTNALTAAALAGANAVQQVANPLAGMINAATAVHKQQTTGMTSGNMLATAVTAKKASNTMADIVDTQMDAMADMAEAGMGFGVMNMMSGMTGMNMMGGMGGMNMLGGGMPGMSGFGNGLGLGGGLGMANGMANGMGLGGNMGMANGMGLGGNMGMANGMGLGGNMGMGGGLGMGMGNTMMSSTMMGNFMSPFGMR